MPFNCPIFTMQLAVSVVGMGLSVTMLATGKDPAVYLPIVTSIIGYWLPAPKKPVVEAPTASSEVSMQPPPKPATPQKTFSGET